MGLFCAADPARAYQILLSLVVTANDSSKASSFLCVYTFAASLAYIFHTLISLVRHLLDLIYPFSSTSGYPKYFPP